jgi:hypothetical protein
MEGAFAGLGLGEHEVSPYRQASLPPSSVEDVWSQEFSVMPAENAEERHKHAVKGDKIMLPHAALSSFLETLKRTKDTERLPTPLCMRITWRRESRVVGIAGWEGPEGTIVVPQWLLDALVNREGHAPGFGDQVTVSSADVPPATSITLVPLSQDIRRLDEDAQLRLLQHGVQGIYTTLTKGDHLFIEGEGGGKFLITKCEPKDSVCMVDANNDVLIVDVFLEESEERRTAREAFASKSIEYRTALDEGGEGALVKDEGLRAKLGEVIAAAEAAEAIGVVFGRELDLAREGLKAAEAAAHLEETARKAKEAAERAVESAAEEAAKRAIEAHEAAEVARKKAEELRAAFLSSVAADTVANARFPEEANLLVRVRMPSGAKQPLERRFAPGNTIAQVRAWLITAYPPDASPKITSADCFVLKTAPLPGSPSMVLDAHLSLREAGAEGGRLLLLLDFPAASSSSSSSS